MKTIGSTIRKSLLYIEWALSGTSLIVMTVCVFLQVFTRYLFHFSFSWPEELARFCFIWASMIGACIAVERKKLHDIDLVFKQLPERLKPIVSLNAHLLVCFILGVLVIYGIKLTAMVHLQTSPAMEVRMSYVYAAVPIASAMMLVSYTLETIDRVVELTTAKRIPEVL